MACAVFLPYGMLAKAAFARAWAQPLSGENLTLANWPLVFMSTSTRAAIVNTLELGLLTACVGAALAALLAYVTSRKLIAGHQILAFLVLTPVVIPGAVLAVGLFIAYTRRRSAHGTSGLFLPISPRRCPRLRASDGLPRDHPS